MSWLRSILLHVLKTTFTTTIVLVAVAANTVAIWSAVNKEASNPIEVIGSLDKMAELLERVDGLEEKAGQALDKYLAE